MDDKPLGNFENTNLQPSSTASFVKKLNIFALIAGLTPIAVIIFKFLTLEGETAGFFFAWFAPLLLLLGLLIFSIWGLIIIILAIKAKINNQFSQSGIKMYHLILAILLLFSIPAYITYEVISMQNYLAYEGTMEEIIAGADEVKTEEEIAKYYYEKIEELDHRGWEIKLQKKIAKKDNVPIIVLRDIFKPLKNQIEKNECFDGLYIEIAEALIENARTPDNILLQLTDLPLIPGYSIDTRETVTRKAVGALTKRGYTCESYESKEPEVCLRSDSKEEFHTPLEETFFKCTKK